MKEDILKTRVNSIIGIFFVGSCALVASLLIWQTAHGYNPLERVFSAHFLQLLQELDK